MKRFKPPAPEFIPARWHGGSQTPGLIVLHATVGPTTKGSARGVARFFQTEDTPTSAHYVVDEAEELQSVGDHTVAYHCGHNGDSLAIEMCFMPLLASLVNWLLPKRARKTKQHARIALGSLRPAVRRMLSRTARLGAELALAYEIPVRFLGVAELQGWDRAGRPAHLGGFTTHAMMSKAFKQSTHWDPGAWPKRLFMRLVRKAVADLSGQPAKPPKKGSGKHGGKKHDQPTPPTPPAPSAPALPTIDVVTVGTHNLHDGAAKPTFFADAVAFTEAILGPVRRAAYSAGYDVYSEHNRTIALAIRHGLLNDVTTEWHQAHGGRAKVSPARGTLVVKGTWADGTLVAFLLGHRVNNAYPPFKHGEGPWRSSRYAEHEALDQRLITDLEAAGYLVFAAGDMNVKPHSDATAWGGQLVEAGTALDRVGASPQMHLAKVTYLSKLGSDHPRLRAEFVAAATPKEKTR